MNNETTAQRLARYLAHQLTVMQSWGADYNLHFTTGTRLEVQFRDGEKIVITFATKKPL